MELKKLDTQKPISVEGFGLAEYIGDNRDKINEILDFLEERDRCCEGGLFGQEHDYRKQPSQEPPKEKEWGDCAHSYPRQNCISCTSKPEINKPELNVDDLFHEFANLDHERTLLDMFTHDEREQKRLRQQEIKYIIRANLR